jgi:hypothetical protein
MTISGTTWNNSSIFNDLKNNVLKINSSHIIEIKEARENEFLKARVARWTARRSDDRVTRRQNDIRYLVEPIKRFRLIPAHSSDNSLSSVLAVHQSLVESHGFAYSRLCANPAQYIRFGRRMLLSMGKPLSFDFESGRLSRCVFP